MNFFMDDEMMNHIMKNIFKSMMTHKNLMENMRSNSFEDDMDDIRERAKKLMNRVEQYKKINADSECDETCNDCIEDVDDIKKFDSKKNSKNLKKITIIRNYEVGGDTVNIEDEINIDNPKNKPVDVVDIIKDYMNNLDTEEKNDFENDKYSYKRSSTSIKLDVNDDECSNDCIDINDDDENVEEVDEDDENNRCIKVKIMAPDDSDITEEEMEELKDEIINAVEKHTDFKAQHSEFKPRKSGHFHSHFNHAGRSNHFNRNKDFKKYKSFNESKHFHFDDNNMKNHIHKSIKEYNRKHHNK